MYECEEVRSDALVVVVFVAAVAVAVGVVDLRRVA
jgi:preprotein translocase subunit SecE